MEEEWIASTLCEVDTSWTGVTGITVDSNGIIYFTTDNEYAYQVNATISPQPQKFFSASKGELNGIVWNPTDNTLYICDNKNLLIYSFSVYERRFSIFAGVGRFGNEDGNTNNATFRYPQGIALDKNGDLYITEYHDIRKISVTQKTVTRIAGSINTTCGWQDGQSLHSKFYAPYGIAVTTDDTIYVADRDNHCIRKIKDGIVCTIAGNPEGGIKNGELKESLFVYPRAIVLNQDGNLLIGDDSGLRLLNFTQQTVSTPFGFPQKRIGSVAYSERHGILVGVEGEIIRLVKNTWKWKRWMWIGHLKENSETCLLATLPREIIKEITTHIK